jgi:3-methyladenine DNA glycosylase AlkC
MEPFKNELSEENAMRIARAVKAAHAAFPMAKFQRGLAAALEPLELKGRVVHLAERMEACLPDDPAAMFPILTDSLEADALRGFLVWPLTEVVARRGLGHFEESMAALRKLTRVFTAEFAIRPFLLAHPEKTLGQLRAWCDDPCEHVRRLVSEGSRPLLPWGVRLPHLFDAPHPTLDLLDRLHRDPSDYVRLSVSNHLNDFSKRHPELVLQRLARWRAAAAGDPKFDKLARHACRTLLKAGHPEAMTFHGYGCADALEVSVVSLGAKRVSLGGALDYRLVVRNRTKRPMKVMFDYAIHHRKANGSLSPKVFKGKLRELAGGETWEIVGRHKFQRVTTRVYYSGRHFFEPQVNGRSFPSVGFMLRVDGDGGFGIDAEGTRG